MLTVAKEFTFEAAHRLINHGGKCRHLHGHSYRAVVEVRAASLDPVSAMVVDFQKVTETIGAWIKFNLDHNAILNVADPLLHFLDDGDRQPYSVHADPTAEKIAELIFNKAKEMLNDTRCTVFRVTVFETPSCSATHAAPVDGHY